MGSNPTGGMELKGSSMKNYKPLTESNLRLFISFSLLLAATLTAGIIAHDTASHSECLYVSPGDERFIPRFPERYTLQNQGTKGTWEIWYGGESYISAEPSRTTEVFMREPDRRGVIYCGDSCNGPLHIHPSSDTVIKSDLSPQVSWITLTDEM